jgi:hypothetical protein
MDGVGVDTVNEALATIEGLLKPVYLSTVQELVVRQCWQGMSYEEIAESSGYDPDYLRGVGARLWQILSNAVGDRISKTNFRSMLRQYSSKRTEESQASPPLNKVELEFPDGPVPLNSAFYIERQAIEHHVSEVILRPGALVHIKAPQRMGKTSWLIRLLHNAQRQQGARTVRLDFRLADSAVLGNLDKFLRWFCANLAYQLHLEPLLDDYWDEDLGSKVSCTNYLQHYLLEAISSPLVIALDETSHLFEYSEITREFLPLLRFWHEEANNLEVWQNLRLVVAYATDLYVPLSIHQSPFNVGLALQVPEFTAEQVLELAKRHGLDWQEDSSENITSLMAMLGGHPHLIRLALYYLGSDRVSFSQLLQEAPTQTGLYSDHLQSYLVTLQRSPELSAALKKVVTAKTSVQLETVAAYQLSRMGLVKLTGNEVVPSCLLYQQYFRDRLS